MAGDDQKGIQISTYDWEKLKGYGRRILLPVLLICIGVFGSWGIDHIDPRVVAQDLRDSGSILQFIPQVILVPLVAVFNVHTFRYMIAPFGAFLFVMVAGAYYVKDIYLLPSFNDGWRYVIASMFARRYPKLTIDKGVKQIKEKTVNLIDRIGGPGHVIVEPGNAAMFRTLHGPSEVAVSSTYFLAPFETIAQALNLDDQQGDKDEIQTVTRDGIRVKLRDVHYRYRIQQEQRNGQPVRRSLDEPYPFSKNALKNVVFNLQVQANGLDSWNAAIERAVNGAMTDYVASKTIDYLTAPRELGKNPRLELKDNLFFSGIKNSLDSYGAELLWVDVGHIEIEEEEVDEQRASLWAADWVGDANVVRAFGDAKRLAYQELGRAEAQAELILSIADALDSANLTDRSTENIRRVFLARTAQILDAIRVSDTENSSE